MLTGLTFNTTASWIIIATGCAFFASFFLALYAWRDASRAAYFFQKREAQQRMQNYTLATIILLVLTITVSSYAAAPQTVQDPIIKVITNAKPQLIVVADDNDESADTAVSSSSLIERVEQVTQLNPLAARAVAIEPTLPDRFQRLEAEADVADSTAISSLAFSTEINDSYAPTAASAEFAAGNFNLYATFEYEQMRNGINWAWVWKHDGNVVGGGEQVWEYGNTGPGYVYFNPSNGFDEGEYSLEIWLNGELVNESTMDVVSSLAR